MPSDRYIAYVTATAKAWGIPYDEAEETILEQAGDCVFHGRTYRDHDFYYGDQCRRCGCPEPGTPDLRDRIAALFRSAPGEECLGDATPGQIADAVLAVLPGTPDRIVPADRVRFGCYLEAIRTAMRPREGFAPEQDAATRAVMAVADEEVVQAMRAMYDTKEKERETHRLALSEVLGLGTGAPWDAIHDRAAELSAAPVDRAAVLREAAVAIETAQHQRDDLVNEALGFLDNNTEQQHVGVHRAAARPCAACTARAHLDHCSSPWCFRAGDGAHRDVLHRLQEAARGEEVTFRYDPRETCSCTLSPGVEEGPARDCPQHGETLDQKAARFAILSAGKPLIVGDALSEAGRDRLDAEAAKVECDRCSEVIAESPTIAGTMMVNHYTPRTGARNRIVLCGSCSLDFREFLYADLKTDELYQQARTELRQKGWK